jgi:hypothetical protein
MFRPEALEHRARAEVPGGELRIGPRWADKVFWLLVLLVAAALAAGALIRIDEYATGLSAVAPDGRALLLVPDSGSGSLETGQRLELGTVETKVARIARRPLDPYEVQERFGIQVSGPSVVVGTDLTEPIPSGTGRVLVGTQPIIVALVPGLDSLFGGGDG